MRQCSGNSSAWDTAAWATASSFCPRSPALNNSDSPREMHCERGRKAMNPPDGYWYSSKELAELLHVHASTIRRWRTSNPLQGPAFVRVSNRVYVYKSHDAEAWLASRRVDPGEVA